MELVIDLVGKWPGYRDALERYFALNAGRAFCEYGNPKLTWSEAGIQRLFMHDDQRTCAVIDAVRWTDTQAVLELRPTGLLKHLLDGQTVVPSARMTMIADRTTGKEISREIHGIDLVADYLHIDYQNHKGYEYETPHSAHTNNLSLHCRNG
jgi:hypothetical protein